MAVPLLGAAAVTKPRAGPQEPLALNIQPPVPTVSVPHQAASSRFPSRMVNSTHDIKGQTLSFKCTVCLSQKQNKKAFQDAFQIPETHWAGKTEPRFLLFLI